MGKELFKSGFLAGTLAALVGVLYLTIEYAFNTLLHPLIAVIAVLLVFCIPLVIAYTSSKYIRNQRFLNRLGYCFSAFFIASTFSLLFNVFLHEVVDRSFKEPYADHVVLKTREAMKKFEKQHKVKVESESDGMCNEIINKFQVKNQLSAYIKSLPIILIVSIFNAIFIFKLE